MLEDRQGSGSLKEAPAFFGLKNSAFGEKKKKKIPLKTGKRSPQSLRWPTGTKKAEERKKKCRKDGECVIYPIWA